MRMLRLLQRLNKGGSTGELTTRYRYMIQSIDGDSNVSSITKFINNQFLTRDTRKFRDLIRELQPDINMEFEYENPQTGEKEAKPIPMGVGFFLAFRVTIRLFFINKFLSYVTMVMDLLKKEFIGYQFISETSIIRNY